MSTDRQPARPARPTRPTELPAPVVTRLITRTDAARLPVRAPVQGSLALDLATLAPAPPLPTVVPAPRQGPPAAAPGPDQDVHSWSRRFAQALVEVVGGHRPVGQLRRWTSPSVFRDLERRVRLVQQAATPGEDCLPLRSTALAQVCSVHVSRPSDDVAEVSVHVRHGRRSRALALRLDRSQDRRPPHGRERGHWICTALEFS